MSYINILILPLLVSLLIGCTSYTQETFPDGTVIPSSSISIISLRKGVMLIPNQHTDLTFKVIKIGNTEVKDVSLRGLASVDPVTKRAFIKSYSLFIEAGDRNREIETPGFVVGEDSKTGISIHCDKENAKDCSVFIMNGGEQWSFVNTEMIDLSNVTMLVKKEN